ncbi:MAG: IS21 family transposase [Gammaproteobacteria bacterium]|nr:MAG: IS21 family transposase [Gammaproteobacteria bacterium]
MRQLTDILRRKYDAGLSRAKIAAALGVSKRVVGKYVSLTETKGLTWPLPDGVDEAALERLLFPATPAHPRFAEPNFLEIHQELKRKGVTLQLLWAEYAAAHGEAALRCSRFCQRYRDWKVLQRRSMRQQHRAGEKLFIDYCGPTVPFIDVTTGEIIQAQIFVAVWGASGYTYAEATRSQSLPDWIGSHQRAMTFFGGCPTLLVPDNLRAAVSAACRYDPQVNRTYADMARHYGVAVLLARLRHCTFHSLVEINAAIRELLGELNERRFQRLPYSRRELFERLDRPAMKPLPEHAYEYAEWKLVKPGIDYHVEIDKRFYSGPHRLVGQRLEARITATSVEVFHKTRRVAVHPRRGAGRYSTLSEHMPEAHRRHHQWSPRRFLNWAKDMGPATLGVVKHQLENRPHPEHGYRACLGLLNLSRHYGYARLEAAAQRALRIGSPSYRSVASILKTGLDRLAAEETPDTPPLPMHENVRGPGYYH